MYKQTAERVGAVLALVFAGFLLLAGPAAAQVYVGVPVPGVGPTDVGGPPAATSSGVAVLSEAIAPAARAQVNSFAFTGADIAETVGIAAAAIVVGVVLVGAARRRNDASAS